MNSFARSISVLGHTCMISGTSTGFGSTVKLTVVLSQHPVFKSVTQSVAECGPGDPKVTLGLDPLEVWPSLKTQLNWPGPPLGIIDAFVNMVGVRAHESPGVN